METLREIPDRLTSKGFLFYNCHGNTNNLPPLRSTRRVGPHCEGMGRSMTSRFRWEFIYLLISFAMTLTVAGWSVASLMPGRKTDAAVDSLESVVVCRDDLDTTLLAGGDLQPTKQATVTCQVEDVTDSDGTMVLSVIENGAAVKKGDELCRLDSSAILELARQEEILVNQAQASYLKARLDLETAKIALKEYEEGLVTQFTSEFRFPNRPWPIRRQATGRPTCLGRGNACQRVSRPRPTAH